MPTVNEFKTVPDLKSLSACMSKMKEEGYVEEFKANAGLLRCLRTDRNYAPDEVKIVNFYRFEGVSDPDDMSILYVIETMDGLKGIVVDAYGTYADTETTEFILEVERIQKKTTGGDSGAA